MNSDFLVRVLASIDPFWYSHPVHSTSAGNHRPAGTGSSSIHRKWFDGATNNDPQVNLHHLAPLCPEILKMLDFLSHSLKNDSFSVISSNWRSTNFYKFLSDSTERELVHFSKGEMGLTIPKPVQVMILGSFRSNIWLSLNEEGVPNMVGTLNSFESLWGEAKNDYLRQLTNHYNDADQEANQFVKRNGPYEIQLIQLVFGQKIPDLPNRFFHFELDQWFERCEKPTHQLKYSDGFGLLVEVSGDVKEGYCRVAQ